MSGTPVGAKPLGENYYIFKGSAISRKLVITSHGGYFPGLFFKPPIKTELVFYGPDGQFLRDPRVGMVVDQNVQEYERISNGGTARDYKLMKFSDDSYPNLLYSAKYAGVDILSVRKRWRPDRWMPSLSDVFKLLEANNYTYAEVHCVFCRNFALSFFAKSYTPPLISR